MPFNNKIHRKSLSVCTYLEVDAAGVAHERLAEGDATLLAANDAALKHEPVLVDLGRKSTDDRKKNRMVIFLAVYNDFIRRDKKYKLDYQLQQLRIKNSIPQRWACLKSKCTYLRGDFELLRLNRFVYTIHFIGHFAQ